MVLSVVYADANCVLKAKMAKRLIITAKEYFFIFVFRLPSTRIALNVSKNKTVSVSGLENDRDASS